MAVKGGYLFIAGAGGLLLWSGLTGKSWSTVFRDVLTGQNPQATTAAYVIQPGTPPAPTGGGGGGGGAGSGRPPPGLGKGGSRAKNLAIGKVLASRYGWGSGANWAALVSLWDSESGWSNTIWNTSASCGNDAFAFGIPQACGHGVNKPIPGHGSWCPFPQGNMGNPPQCGGINSASAQIAWGLAYIKQNYGQPVNVPHGGY